MCVYFPGISAQNIISITKHKNVSSLSSYIEQPSNKQRRECSDILTAVMTGESKQQVSIFKDIYVFNTVTWLNLAGFLSFRYIAGVIAPL